MAEYRIFAVWLRLLRFNQLHKSSSLPLRSLIPLELTFLCRLHCRRLVNLDAHAKPLTRRVTSSVDVRVEPIGFGNVTRGSALYSPANRDGTAARYPRRHKWFSFFIASKISCFKKSFALLELISTQYRPAWGPRSSPSVSDDVSRRWWRHVFSNMSGHSFGQPAGRAKDWREGGGGGIDYKFWGGLMEIFSAVF